MRACLSPDAPLDLERTLSRYRIWGDDPVNRLTDRTFRRAVRVEGQWHAYEVTWEGERDAISMQITVPRATRVAVMDAALDEVRHICGLDLDLAAFYRAVARDPVLSPLTRRLRGLRPTLTPQAFEMLVSSICAQQVNLPFAFAVRARLVRRFGAAVGIGGDVVHAFPEPAVLARARVDELRQMQFTTRKAEYIVGLARQVADGQLDLRDLASSSNQRVIETLTAVRGFGRWTAEWFLARGLGRGDVCPAGDLGVRRAFEHFYNRGRELSERAIRRRARAWGPHQNLVVHYLLAGKRDALARAGGTP